MAVIDLTGRSTPDLSGLASGLAMLFAPSREEKLKQMLQLGLVQNPQLLAQAFRAEQEDLQAGMGVSPDIGDARKRVDVPTAGSSLGFTPSMMEELSRLLPETVQERTSKAALKAGLPEKQVEAATAEAGAKVATAEFEGRTAKALLAANIPERSAEAQLLQFHVQQAKGEQELQALEEYAKYLGQLSGRDRQRAIMAMANPTFLQDIQFRESLDLQRDQFNFQKRLAEAATAKDAAEMQLKLFGVKQAFLDEFRKIETAFREGKFAEGERDALIARYNQLSDDYLRIFPGDPVTVLDPIEAVFGSETKDASFRTLFPEDVQTRVVVARILAGEWKQEDVLSSTMLSEQQKNNILTTLQDLESRRQKGTLENFANALLEGLKTIAVEGNPMGGTLIGSPFGLPGVPPIPRR